MNLAFRGLRVYLRLAFIVAVGAGVGLVLFMNRTNEVRFWFFGLRDETKPVNVVWLMIGTVGCTLVAWWTLALAWRVFRDWRELRRLRAIDERDRVHREKEKELETRERRLEEKLKEHLETDDAGGKDMTSHGPPPRSHEGET